ncbi:hypothetical protein [Guyparkeria sp.]|uniref:hypothetical protein n=1 Tax=Guyparkeria sp. TaxID=2035736 RepID=UPI0035647C7A
MPIHRREPQQVGPRSSTRRWQSWAIGCMLVLNLVFARLIGAQGEVTFAWSLLALAPLAVIVLLLVAPFATRPRQALAVAIVPATLLLAALLQDHVALIYLVQHLAVHAALAAFFLGSLAQGRTPACTRFAAQVHETMSPALLGYTRIITWAWGLFFVANGLVSAGLMLVAGADVWVDYALYITFPLVIGMFMLEYLLRLAVLPREDLSSPVSAIVAYRRHMRQLAERQERP